MNSVVEAVDETQIGGVRNRDKQITSAEVWIAWSARSAVLTTASNVTLYAVSLFQQLQEIYFPDYQYPGK